MKLYQIPEEQVGDLAKILCGLCGKIQSWTAHMYMKSKFYMDRDGHIFCQDCYHLVNEPCDATITSLCTKCGGCFIPE